MEQSLTKQVMERLDMDAYQQKKCTWALRKEESKQDPHIHTNK